MLKIRSLTKKFKEKTVLMDVNLDIHSGSVFGLIGPNGSGKSTLLKIMAGIMKPDLGCICIDDESVIMKNLDVILSAMLCMCQSRLSGS